MIRALIEQTFDSTKKYLVLFGLSTDNKPVSGLITGSEFHEVDTGVKYEFDEVNSQWHEVGITEQEIKDEIDAWLDDHPEATTTVEDGAISYAKLDSSLKGTVDDVADLKTDMDDKANVDGYYISLTAGNAEQLVSDKGVTEKTPYLARSTGGGASVGDRLMLQEITGGTVAFNQLVKNGDFADTSEWTAYKGSLAVSDNVATYTVSEVGTTSVSNRLANSFKDYIVGHKYLFAFDAKSSVAGARACLSFAGSNDGVFFDLPTADTWVRGMKIVEESYDDPGSSRLWLRWVNASSTASVDDTMSFRNVMLIDLTAMFGPTIADYLYTLESNTDGAGVAQLKSWGFFTEDYYAYDPGSLLSVKTTAHKTYDADNNVIGNYAIDDVELGGILKLDANNNLYYEGDSYPPNGSATRKYSVVNLGELTWTKSTDSEYNVVLFTAVSGSKIKAKQLGIYEAPNAVCSFVGLLPKARYGSHGIIEHGENGICVSNDSIRVRNSAFDAMTAEEVKTAFAGAQLLYELKYQTTESADPYQEIQVCAGDGTEQFVDGRTVPMPVGYTALYMADLRSKLESAPENPSANGDYIVRKTNSGNAYVPLIGELPADPAEDGTYTLKVTVADGVATLSWEADT